MQTFRRKFPDRQWNSVACWISILEHGTEEFEEGDRRERIGSATREECIGRHTMVIRYHTSIIGRM